ncbi:unnamed protein product [Amoebophrya sp. A25]|nr:unnamed protein product [Amoebophrya sp. A25]|eukprot:GSA25T00000176001.1
MQERELAKCSAENKKLRAKVERLQKTQVDRDRLSLTLEIQGLKKLAGALQTQADLHSLGYLRLEEETLLQKQAWESRERELQNHIKLLCAEVEHLRREVIDARVEQSVEELSSILTPMSSAAFRVRGAGAVAGGEQRPAGFFNDVATSGHSTTTPGSRLAPTSGTSDDEVVEFAPMSIDDTQILEDLEAMETQARQIGGASTKRESSSKATSNAPGAASSGASSIKKSTSSSVKSAASPNDQMKRDKNVEDSKTSRAGDAASTGAARQTADEEQEGTPNSPPPRGANDKTKSRASMEIDTSPEMVDAVARPAPLSRTIEEMRSETPLRPLTEAEVEGRLRDMRELLILLHKEVPACRKYMAPVDTEAMQAMERRADARYFTTLGDTLSVVGSTPETKGQFLTSGGATTGGSSSSSSPNKMSEGAGGHGTGGTSGHAIRHVTASEKLVVTEREEFLLSNFFKSLFDATRTEELRRRNSYRGYFQEFDRNAGASSRNIDALIKNQEHIGVVTAPAGAGEESHSGQFNNTSDIQRAGKNAAEQGPSRSADDITAGNLQQASSKASSTLAATSEDQHGTTTSAGLTPRDRLAPGGGQVEQPSTMINGAGTSITSSAGAGTGAGTLGGLSLMQLPGVHLDADGRTTANKDESTSTSSPNIRSGSTGSKDIIAALLDPERNNTWQPIVDSDEDDHEQHRGPAKSEGNVAKDGGATTASDGSLTIKIMGPHNLGVGFSSCSTAPVRTTTQAASAHDPANNLQDTCIAHMTPSQEQHLHYNTAQVIGQGSQNQNLFVSLPGNLNPLAGQQQWPNYANATTTNATSTSSGAFTQQQHQAASSPADYLPTAAASASGSSVVTAATTQSTFSLHTRVSPSDGSSMLPPPSRTEYQSSPFANPVAASPQNTINPAAASGAPGTGSGAMSDLSAQHSFLEDHADRRAASHLLEQQQHHPATTHYSSSPLQVQQFQQQMMHLQQSQQILQQSQQQIHQQSQQQQMHQQSQQTQQAVQEQPQQVDHTASESDQHLPSATASSPHDNATVAGQGGQQELKPGWGKYSTEDGDTYFFNTITGESSWDPPPGFD